MIRATGCRVYTLDYHLPNCQFEHGWLIVCLVADVRNVHRDTIEEKGNDDVGDQIDARIIILSLEYFPCPASFLRCFTISSSMMVRRPELYLMAAARIDLESGLHFEFCARDYLSSSWGFSSKHHEAP